MLKKRIIPVMLLSDDRLVKTRRFSEPRDVGDPAKSASVYNSQNADELIFLNIARGERSIDTLRRIIEEVSRVCFMPVAFGGGIETVCNAAELIRTGADKIVLNSAAYRDRSVISGIAANFGKQAVVVCIDVRWDIENRRHVPYSNCGRVCEAVLLEDHIDACVAAGAGEIMIQSIDRDGMMNGFDTSLVHRVMRAANVPVIAAGGSGDYAHLRDLFLATDVSAIACGSLFNFSDSNPMRAKAFLTNYDIRFKVV